MGPVTAQEHPLVAAARELERRDAELAARIDELTQLESELAGLRRDMEHADSRRLELPVVRDRLVDELREATLEVARRQAAVREAEVAVARGEDRESAERTVATAETALADAEARVTRLGAEKASVEREAEAIDTESAQLAARAQELGAGIRVEVGDDFEHWAARARAALFAERTHAEGERRRLQEEAAELAAAVTGGAIVGDVPRVRQAVEATLAG
jgi:chromosome segregation ATPase